MNIPVISRLLKKRSRRRLRHMMRGYRLTRDSGRLKYVAQVCHELAQTPLSDGPIRFNRNLFGAAFDAAELSTRQYLTIRSVGFGFNQALLIGESIQKPQAFMVPKTYRRKLSELGVRVAPIRSTILWSIFVLLMWGYGVRQFLLLATATVGNGNDEKSAHFIRLSKSNLPCEINGKPGATLLNWYAGKWAAENNVRVMTHTVNSDEVLTVNGIAARSRSTDLPGFDSLSSRVEFLGWGVYAGALTFLDMLTGRWWHAFMLSEIANARLVEMTDRSKLAAEYWLHNSGHIYRPLWTYPAHAKESDIILYFYSTNIEAFRIDDGEHLQNNTWDLINWPHYVVWDQRQSDFVSSFDHNEPTISVVGEIPFSDCAKELPKINAQSIAVFEIQPTRYSIYRRLGTMYEFYTPAQTIAFFDDILEVCSLSKRPVVWKRKRNIGSNVHHKFRNYVNERLDGDPGIQTIDPDISAHRVVRECDLVISMPFTSTALIGRELGKPSCYYDALGLVQPDDPASHGIPIVQGRDALLQWIKKHSNT